MKRKKPHTLEYVLLGMEDGKGLNLCLHVWGGGGGDEPLSHENKAVKITKSELC